MNKFWYIQFCKNLSFWTIVLEIDGIDSEIWLWRGVGTGGCYPLLSNSKRGGNPGAISHIGRQSPKHTGQQFSRPFTASPCSCQYYFWSSSLWLGFWFSSFRQATKWLDALRGSSTAHKLWLQQKMAMAKADCKISQLPQIYIFYLSCAKSGVSKTFYKMTRCTTR